MNTDNADLDPPDGGNPFPPVFVAPVQDFDSRAVTIETAVIRQTAEYLADYLHDHASAGGGSDRDQARPGNVLAVVGGYGTGKTHLAMHLIHLVRTGANAGRNVHTMYLDAPAETFLSLYLTRFVPRLQRSEVSQRVRDYYADVVADSLEGVDFAAGITERLRSRAVDPQQIVDRMGLMGTAFLQTLQKRLRSVTKNDAFGVALTLLLREGFESAVWEWFAGNPPDKILQERGITETIDSEADAMEAIGVFAILYGSQDHGFVLVIDELEKMLAVPQPLSVSAAQAFKKLLTVVSESGTFLVLSGLPDFLQSLNSDIRDRIGPVIRTAALTTGDVSHYIEDSMERKFGERRLAPFTQDAVDYLTTLAGGNARRVIQLCHYTYRAATGKTAVNRAMIRKAARDQFELLTIDDMRAEVRYVLDSRGWTFLPGHVGGDPEKPRVDYWIPVGEDAGCAVLLTDSVLYEKNVADLQQRVQTINASVSACRTLLVINGYLDPGLAEPLRGALTDEPIVYDSRRFIDDFDAALVGVTKRLEALTREDELPIIRGRMERMSHMQTRTQDFLEQFVAYFDEARSATERRLGAMERSLQEITGVVRTAVGRESFAGDSAEGERAPDSEAVPLPGSRAGSRADSRAASQAGPPAAFAQQLPAKVEQHFERALNSLDDLSRLGTLVRNEFVHTPGQAGIRSILFRDSSRAEEAFYSVGVAVLLQRLVTTFYEELRQWYQGLRRRLPLTLRDTEESRLHYLCQTYESIYESLPVFLLDDLTRLTAGAGQRGDPIGQATRWSRRADIRETLGGLSGRVQSAILESLETG